MPLYPGLLVSCQKGHEASASSEIFFALTKKLEIDESAIYVRDTRISGLITVKLSEDLDYRDIIRSLMRLDEETPFFMHCLKIKPIQHVVDEGIDSVVDKIKQIDDKRDGSFRITVSKRHTPLSSMDIISPVADLYPDNTVDLENPDWEILVEIIADQIGISIIEPELIYSTQLAYEELNDEVENWFLS